MHKYIQFKEILKHLPVRLPKRTESYIEAELVATKIEHDIFELRYLVRVIIGSYREDFLIYQTYEKGSQFFERELRKVPMSYTVQAAEYLFTCLRRFIEMREGVLKLIYHQSSLVNEPSFSPSFTWEKR